MEQNSQKPLSVDDAVQFTGWKKSYIYKLVYLGKLKAYKPNNGKLFFRRTEIEEFLFRNKESTFNKEEA